MSSTVQKTVRVQVAFEIVVEIEQFDDEPLSSTHFEIEAQARVRDLLGALDSISTFIGDTTGVTEVVSAETLPPLT